MKVIIVLGSVREKNKTAEAAKLANELLIKMGHQVELLDPSEIRTPTLGANFDEVTIEQIRGQVTNADAIVLCTPEYHGNFSSTLMALLENLDYPSVLAGKPVALIGVAAGKLGAVKALEHLRSVAAHCGAYVVPKVTSIANSFKVLPDSGGVLDPTVEPWMESMLMELVDLARRLKVVFD